MLSNNPSAPTWPAGRRVRAAAGAGRGPLRRLEPLSAARHAAELYQAFSQAPDGRDWTYMSVGPFASEAEYRAFAERAEAGQDPAPRRHRPGQRQGRGHAVADAHRSGQWRDRGGLRQLPLLKRTRIATEAQFLLMRRVFDELGYRRYEWKCDSLNAPSRAPRGWASSSRACSARPWSGPQPRHGLVLHHRQRMALRAAYERWLSPDNFDAEGGQRVGLAELIARERAACA